LSAAAFSVASSMALITTALLSVASLLGVAVASGAAGQAHSR
jgi:hypothetical protein